MTSGQGVLTAQWLARRFASWTDRQIAVGLFCALSVLYLSTATYSLTGSIDTISASMPAWSLGSRGTLALNDYAGLSPFFFEVNGNTYSDRFPGAVVLAAPAYWLVARFGLMEFSLIPAAATAALASAAAVTVMYLVFRQLAPPRWALWGSVLAGVGTTTWGVSADALWTHGPAQLALALALLCIVQRRWILAGLCCGAAVFIRPNSAIIALVLVLWLAFREKSWTAALGLGLASALGVAGLLSYNVLLFGRPGFSGAYDPLTANVMDMSWAAYLQALGRSLVSQRGVLIWSPFLVALVPGLPAAWRSAAGWVKAASIAALAYHLFQYRISSSSGDGFFGYRFELEALVLAAPLLMLAWVHWTSRMPVARRVFGVGAVLAFGFNGFGALLERLA